MVPTRVLLLGAGLVAVLSVTLAHAQEDAARELRERVEAMAREAEHLRAEGRQEDAENLAREIDRLREKAERAAVADAGEPGLAERIRNRIRELTEQWADAIAEHRQDAMERLEREMHELARETGTRLGPLLKAQVDVLERRVAELRQQGRGELADELAERIREMVQTHRRAMVEAMQPHHAEPPRGPRMEPGAEQERRLHHLRAAAENLEAAGRQEGAERLRHEVAELEQQLRQPPSPPQRALAAQLENLQQEVRRLHERLDTLQRSMDELLELARQHRQER